MHIHFDEDEWEAVSEHRPCSCGGYPGGDRCVPGMCNASSSYTMRRRDPAEVKRIKAERERKREDEILAQAEAIKARRAINAGH